MVPSAHATLIVLGCAMAELERDRLARHLDPQECEHRMAAIRADQDTALIFSVDLEVVESPVSLPLGPPGTGSDPSPRGRALSYRGSEWVAMWPFRPEETHRP